MGFSVTWMLVTLEKSNPTLAVKAANGAKDEIFAPAEFGTLPVKVAFPPGIFPSVSSIV